MFVISSETAATEAEKGITRKLLGRGGSMTMAEVTFKKHAEGAVHAHVHEQVCYIVEGKFEFTLDGQMMVLQKGDSVYVPSNTPHGAKALEEHSVILDVFTPQRKDFYQGGEEK